MHLNLYDSEYPPNQGENCQNVEVGALFSNEK